MGQRYYEGCYGGEDGSYELEIDGDEIKLKMFDKPGCDASDKTSTNEGEDGECAEGNQKWEIIEMDEKDDFFKYESYDHKEDSQCDVDNLEISAIGLLEDLEDECNCKCTDDRRRLSSSSDEPECKVWEKITFEGTNMVITRYDKKKCKDDDKSETFPVLTIPGNGQCTELLDVDCDEDETKSHVKVWLTQDGRSANGQNLRISQSVIALACLGLMATLV